jgi:uncharacterized protein YndB with AHSA1/START domain
MSNNTVPFEIERTFDAPVNIVWNAITNKDEMKKWYFDLEEFEPEIGFKFQFAGTGSDGTVYIHLCEVTELIPGRKLTHSWRYEGIEGMSYVTWELHPEAEKTRLKLTHAGLETFPQNKPDFARESFAAGWTQIVATNLLKYLESK